jgi:hypothetical protein
MTINQIAEDVADVPAVIALVKGKRPNGKSVMIRDDE